MHHVIDAYEKLTCSRVDTELPVSFTMAHPDWHETICGWVYHENSIFGAPLYIAEAQAVIIEHMTSLGFRITQDTAATLNGACALMPAAMTGAYVIDRALNVPFEIVASTDDERMWFATHRTEQRYGLLPGSWYAHDFDTLLAVLKRRDMFSR